MANTHDDTDPRSDGRPNKRSESNHGDASGNDRTEGPQYVSLTLEDGDIVIYDPDNHRAWIQSDLAVEATSAL